MLPTTMAADVYRYVLHRRWDDRLPRVAFVMLNPSTADETHDDPTIRRCTAFARRWRFGSLEVVNLYAYRATRPADLWAANAPIGPQNDRYLQRAAARADRVVLAWGNGGGRAGRGAAVAQMLGRIRPLSCLGLTRLGQPRHPLYARRETSPGRFHVGLRVATPS